MRASGVVGGNVGGVPGSNANFLLIASGSQFSGSKFATGKVPMAQRTTNTILTRLLAFVLLLGTQTWMLGLRAVEQRTMLFETGSLPYEVEDQNEGPDQDPDLGMVVVQGVAFWAACVRFTAPGASGPDRDRSGSSVLTVTGLQPSAP